MRPRLRSATLRAALVACLAAPACGDRSGPDALPLVRTGPAGLLLSDTTLLDVRWAWFPEQSRVAVLTPYAPMVRLYTADGAPVARFGPDGDGPGEFRIAWGPVQNADALEIWDPRLARIIRLSSDGTEAATTPVRGLIPNTLADIQEITFGDPFQVAAHPDGYVVQAFPNPIHYAAHMLYGSLVVLSSAGVVIDTLFSFRDVPDRERVVGGARRLIPVPLWGSCPSGALVLYDGVTSDLRVMTPAADRDAVIRPLPPHLHLGRRLTDAEVRRYIRYTMMREYLEFGHDTTEIPAEVDRILAEARSWFGSVAPTVTRVLCDETSAIWLNEFSTDDSPIGYSRFWTVLGPDDTYRVEMPAGFRVHHIRNGRAIGTVADRDDVRSVAVVRLRP